MKIKKPAKKKQDTSQLMESVGITAQPLKRERRWAIYTLWYHLRSQIDHSKFPNAKWKKVEDSPMFATWNEADKQCRKLEKQNPTLLYSCRMSWLNESEIPKKILKKIEERGW